MTHNNNLNPLPWYTSIDQQNHRKSYVYGEIYPLYTQANFMLPWQVQTSLTGSIERIYLNIYHEDGTLFQAADPSAIDRDISVVTDTGCQYIVCVPLFPFVTNQPDGRYYATLRLVNINDEEVTYYSEVYTVVQSLATFLKIEWWDEASLVYDGGMINYSSKTNYHNHIYLPTELGKPEYTFEETGEDRDGFYFPEKQLSEKTYRFSFLAPEYMLDAMRIIRLSDYVIITDQFGVEYKADKFLMTPKWTQNGDLAQVDVEFQTNTVIKKIGRGIVTGGVADYNADYNNDYLINSQNS